MFIEFVVSTNLSQELVNESFATWFWWETFIVDELNLIQRDTSGIGSLLITQLLKKLEAGAMLMEELMVVLIMLRLEMSKTEARNEQVSSCSSSNHLTSHMESPSMLTKSNLQIERSS